MAECCPAGFWRRCCSATTRHSSSESKSRQKAQATSLGATAWSCRFNRSLLCDHWWGSYWQPGRRWQTQPGRRQAGCTIGIPEWNGACSGAKHTPPRAAPLSGSLPNSEGDQGTGTVTGPHTERHVQLTRQAITTTARLIGSNAPAALIRSAAAASQGPSGSQGKPFLTC